MYKVLDIKNWKRYKQYKWFSSFVNPCYGIDATIDVTDVVNYSKTTNTSFFINFLFYYLIFSNVLFLRVLRIRATV